MSENRVRKINSDKDLVVRPARAYSGPASVGIEFDELTGEETLVTMHGSANDSRRRYLQREMQDTVYYMDDFLGDVLRDEYTLLAGSDDLAVAPVILAARNGQVDLVGGDVGGGDDAVDASQIAMALNWDASVTNGRLFMEARVKIAAITTTMFFVGFTDSIALEVPIHSAGSANTITTNATDAVGIMFDTDMDDDNLWAVGVDTNTDATHEDLGSAPVAGTWIRLGVELFDDATARFYINGTRTGGVMTGACTPTIDLTPTVAVMSRTTAIATLSMDYWRMEQSRV